MTAAPNAYWLEHPSLSGSSGEIVSYRAATRQLTITCDGLTENRTQTLFDYLDETLRAHRSDLPFPACGGYVGYFGYELRSDCGSPVTHATRVVTRGRASTASIARPCSA